MPMTPTRRPVTSPPPRWEISNCGQPPVRIPPSAQASHRRTAYDAPTHHSATLTALAPAALASGIPCAASASPSIESTPTLGCCTKATRPAVGMCCGPRPSPPVQSPSTRSTSASAVATASAVRSAGTWTSTGRSANSPARSAASSGGSARSCQGSATGTIVPERPIFPPVPPAPLVTLVTLWLRLSVFVTGRRENPMSPRTLLTRTAPAGVAVLLAIAVTASTSGGNYRVRPGDTLSAIAARYHTSVAALVQLNHLPGNGNLIYAGSTLRLPGHHRGSHARHGSTITYVVHPGDSLYGIAGRFHANPQHIARRNHLPSSLMVEIGQRLRIHVQHAGHAHHARHHARHHRAAGFHGYAVPSREAVAGMIRSTAARWHLDGRFALGISYEEAGFNQRMISSVGAVGAMQVMPSTGRWISAYVVRRPLDIYRAQDNVTAGVALLSVLLRETGGNMRLAAAGYYQGLASVHDHGMFADTKRYVANVMALRNRF